MLSFERSAIPGIHLARRKRDIRGAAGDQLAGLAVLTLIVLGLLNMYAVGGVSLAAHQGILAAAAFVVLLVLRWLGARWLIRLGWACYLVSLAMLLAVPVIGLEENGAQRWLSVGSITFQPAELVKLGLVFALADVLGSKRPAWRRFTYALGLAVIPLGLVVVQPDLSTTVILTAVTASLLVIGRLPPRFLVPLFGGTLLVIPLAVPLLRPYQLDRLQTFIFGSSAAGPGWTILQSHIALASGGMYGQPNDAMHRVLSTYLPARETDLALTSLVQQWGLVAGAVAILAAMVLVWRLALASRAASTPRGTLVGAGLAVLLGVEVMLTLGGNLGLLPLAGVPFPLLSYGGTASVVHIAGIGFVLGIRRDSVRHRLWAAPRSRTTRPRFARITAFGLTCVLVGFAGYGWTLQEERGHALRLRGADQMTRCVSVPAPRGEITDRHGRPLAADAHRADVQTFPAMVLRERDSVTRLARLTGRSSKALRHELAHTDELTMQVGSVRDKVGREIAAANIPGVWLTQDPKRWYPHNASLAPILGFVGIATPDEVKQHPEISPQEFVGRSGLEARYDAVLRGMPGKRCVYVKPEGDPVMLASHRAPVPGADLRTSLDLGLQRKVTRNLAGAIHGKYGRTGTQGGAVAMDPHTGQILAMASKPSYDPAVYGPPIRSKAFNRLMHRENNPTLEHVTQVAAAPGSTFKLVIASADVKYHAIPPEEVIPTGGAFTYGGHTFHNWTTLGPMNLTQAIAHSNDVYFYKLAVALGQHRITRVAHQLGVGRQTGIDLPAESAGYLGTPKSVRQAGGQWYGGSTVLLGIGQGYLTVTPLQNARWTAGVATGRLPTPRLGMATVTDRGASALHRPSPRRLPFAKRLHTVRAGMRSAVTSGTATLLGDLPVRAGAKTGSAQNPAAGGTDSWFTAAAPIHKPDVVMTAYVRRAGEGAQTAGPLVDDSLHYFYAHKHSILASPAAGRPG
ncbi:MAG: FtsW/RodA/SpoVE family cell cycle protein [Streptosporangiales bacterium]